MDGSVRRVSRRLRQIHADGKRGKKNLLALLPLPSICVNLHNLRLTLLVIPTVQTARRCPQHVQEQHQRVDSRGPPTALLEVFPRGRSGSPDVRIATRVPPPQPAGKIHVLHEWDVREPAHAPRTPAAARRSTGRRTAARTDGSAGLPRVRASAGTRVPLVELGGGTPRPPSAGSAAMAARRLSRWASVSSVSAWWKSRMSPVARRAASFIWLPRPGRANRRPRADRGRRDAVRRPSMPRLADATRISFTTPCA